MKRTLKLNLILAILLGVLATAARGQTPLNLVPGDNRLGAGSFSWPSGRVVPNGANIIGVRGQTTILLTPDAFGQGMQYKGDNWTVKDVVIRGGRIHLDKSGGRNTNITFDNVEFRDSPNNFIHFTSGLNNSRITNCLFTGSKGLAIYGYHYLGLTIANNEFIDCDAGMHIDAFGGSGNLLVEQNYLSGMSGMGLEFQGTAMNLVFQDNFYEKPRNTNNSNKMAYSLILDKSSNITIRRNLAVMPTRAQEPQGYVRIVFEVGGDNSLVEDNYSNGGNHVLAMNDGVGSSSVTVRNNRFLNFHEGIRNSFPSPDRVLTQSNNGPNVALTWDINRPRPRRNVRTGTTEPTPPPPTEPPPPSELDQLRAKVAELEQQLQTAGTERAALQAEVARINAKIAAARQALE